MSEPRHREFYIGSHLVIVDEEMIPILSKYTWHVIIDKKTAYACTNFKIKNKNHRMTMHRFLTGMSSSQVDHKNRNGLDNRLSNLRFATKEQNSCNRVRKNKFGYRGVTQAKRCKTFSINIRLGKKRISRHGFKTAEDAAREYDKISKELHGEFGIRNFKD